ncbi:S8 family serine peptidase [Rhodoferax sp.]|uniref:S8 family serine peptidase n=1 Tax=Rhodoferax sp. TaxID=50421 RepID=UPI002615D6C8|nr:S8 family serine peptidase [Rhodoferax sp.]MDD2923584.1 S8 family serine peptidase [Rhodoferax sp.]
MLLVLAGCGGGSGSNSPSLVTPPVADDPLAAYAWHLNNTGPTQTVSAIDNSDAVAGIDAHVASVHLGGAGLTGKGIRIAVVDSGLEIGHEDVSPNVLAGMSFNFLNNSSDPSPSRTRADSNLADHGTAVAGVAAAKGWNNLGSRGLAPNASLQGFAPLELVNGVAEGLSFGAHADLVTAVSGTDLVLANTFGSRADLVDIFNYSAGADYASPKTDPTAPDPRTISAHYGTTALRAGKGAIYFQAAGNEFLGSREAFLQDGSTMLVRCAGAYAQDGILERFSNSAAGYSCLDTNYEIQGQPYFMKVAAIAANGRVAPYSSAGASNWVTGFGGESGTDKPAIVAPDDSGCDLGQNNVANQASLVARYAAAALKLVADLFGQSKLDPHCNYTGTMNGTSAAAPSLSGIAALMLEANPALSWLDVKYILAKTARQVDSGIAHGAQAVTYLPVGASQPLVLSDPWVTNQGGFHFQPRYGFGLADAAAAVAMAKTYAPPSGRRAAPLTANLSGASSASNLAPSAGNVAVITQDATFPAGVSGPIQVDLTLTNTTGRALNPGTLQFELLNTLTGERSILLPAYGAWYVGGKTDQILANGRQQFRFFTNAFYGDSLTGTWTLQIMLVDGPANESSTFNTSTLTGVTLTSYSI